MDKIPHRAIYLLLPLEGIGILVFLAYAAFHWSMFLASTVNIINWLVWFAGLSLYTVLAFLMVRVCKEALETIGAFAQAIAEAHSRFTATRIARARIELLETRDNYVVYRQGGQIIVQPTPRQVAQLSPAGDDVPALPPGQGALPTNVLYETIRHQIPANHVLVGVGSNGIETRDKAIGACTWIVGLSRTGKTSTTVLRIEERASAGHKFYGVDPHFFKPDSLSNAISAYSGKFIKPIAHQPQQILDVLNAFMGEFNARKSGKVAQPWQPITLVVDEVTSLMDPTNDEEKEIKELLPSIARICGQEAANFNMNGIFISQQATHLAWLRKMALMIIVHQLLQESEKKLALNGDAEVMEAMKRWPIGRTYVYGVGFTAGPITVQQPFFETPKAAAQASTWQHVEEENTIDSTIELDDENEPTTEELPVDEDIREAMEAYRQGAKGPRAIQRALGCTYYRAIQICEELSRQGVQAD